MEDPFVERDVERGRGDPGNRSPRFQRGDTPDSMAITPATPRLPKSAWEHEGSPLTPYNTLQDPAFNQVSRDRLARELRRLTTDRASSLDGSTPQRASPTPLRGTTPGNVLGVNNDNAGQYQALDSPRTDDQLERRVSSGNEGCCPPWMPCTPPSWRRGKGKRLANDDENDPGPASNIPNPDAGGSTGLWAWLTTRRQRSRNTTPVTGGFLDQLQSFFQPQSPGPPVPTADNHKDVPPFRLDGSATPERPTTRTTVAIPRRQRPHRTNNAPDSMPGTPDTAERFRIDLDGCAAEALAAHVHFSKAPARRGPRGAPGSRSNNTVWNLFSRPMGHRDGSPDQKPAAAVSDRNDGAATAFESALRSKVASPASEFIRTRNWISGQRPNGPDVIDASSGIVAPVSPSNGVPAPIGTVRDGSRPADAVFDVTAAVSANLGRPTDPQRAAYDHSGFDARSSRSLPCRPSTAATIMIDKSASAAQSRAHDPPSQPVAEKQCRAPLRGSTDSAHAKPAVTNGASRESNIIDHGYSSESDSEGLSPKTCPTGHHGAYEDGGLKQKHTAGHGPTTPVVDEASADDINTGGGQNTVASRNGEANITARQEPCELTGRTVDTKANRSPTATEKPEQYHVGMAFGLPEELDPLLLLPPHLSPLKDLLRLPSTCQHNMRADPVLPSPPDISSVDAPQTQTDPIGEAAEEAYHTTLKLLMWPDSGARTVTQSVIESVLAEDDPKRKPGIAGFLRNNGMSSLADEAEFSGVGPARRRSVDVLMGCEKKTEIAHVHPSRRAESWPLSRTSPTSRSPLQQGDGKSASIVVERQRNVVLAGSRPSIWPGRLVNNGRTARVRDLARLKKLWSTAARKRASMRHPPESPGSAHSIGERRLSDLLKDTAKIDNADVPRSARRCSSSRDRSVMRESFESELKSNPVTHAQPPSDTDETTKAASPVRRRPSAIRFAGGSEAEAVYPDSSPSTERGRDSEPTRREPAAPSQATTSTPPSSDALASITPPRTIQFGEVTSVSVELGGIVTFETSPPASGSGSPQRFLRRDGEALDEYLDALYGMQSPESGSSPEPDLLADENFTPSMFDTALSDAVKMSADLIKLAKTVVPEEFKRHRAPIIGDPGPSVSPTHSSSRKRSDSSASTICSERQRRYSALSLNNDSTSVG